MSEELDAGLVAEQIREHPEQIDRPDPTRHVGKPLRRKEDARLLTGRTRWTDNISLPGLLHVAILRSPIAHARITRVDVVAGARAARRGRRLQPAPTWPTSSARCRARGR